MTESNPTNDKSRDAYCCPEESRLTQIATPGRDKDSLQILPWVFGFVRTNAGDIPIVSTKLSRSDKIGIYKARWGINRMNFRVEPGLYATGEPDEKSPVFVSANYKMSFDRLRSGLSGIDSWIMVLDTKGINVWCAAGKGTFGTTEIIKQIENTRLAEIVTHRRLIVPQLGAPGVQAHEVKNKSGFRVRYGPVRADDIQAYLENGSRATPEMRLVKFPFRERIVLTPNDLISYSKYPLLAGLVIFLLSGLGPDLYSVDRMINYGLVNAIILLLVYAAGIILPAALLPYLPGRSFSLKGFWVGLAAAILVAWFALKHPGSVGGSLAVMAWFGIAPATASFIAMNFTGSSTYTSLSGVLKEMKVALPIQIGLAVAGLGLWVTGLFV